jgi:hypothetical protein
MQKELVNYIQDVLSKGFKPDQIRQTLQQAGYSDEAISEAFASLPAEQRRGGHLYLWLIILTALFVAVSGALIIYLTGTTEPQQTKLPAAQQPEECGQRAPGQWCYSVSAQGISSEGCSNTQEKCMYAYYADLAAANSDEKICNKILDAQSKDLCYGNVAARKNDIGLCGAISDYQQKSSCIGTVAGQLKNTALCETAPSKDDCYSAYGMMSQDQSVCALISNETTRSSCEFFTTPPPPIPE